MLFWNNYLLLQLSVPGIKYYNSKHIYSGITKANSYIIKPELSRMPRNNCCRWLPPLCIIWPQFRDLTSFLSTSSLWSDSSSSIHLQFVQLKTLQHFSLQFPLEFRFLVNRIILRRGNWCKTILLFYSKRISCFVCVGLLSFRILSKHLYFCTVSSVAQNVSCWQHVSISIDFHDYSSSTVTYRNHLQ